MNPDSNSRGTLQRPKISFRPANSVTRNKESPENALKQLQKAITEIYHQRQSQLRFEECYRNTYFLVRANKENVLHKMSIRAMGENLEELVKIHLCSQYMASSFVSAANLKSPSIRASSPSSAVDSVVPTSCQPNPTALESTTEQEAIFTHSDAQIGANFLKALDLVWQRHLLSLPKIASILVYMDTYFLEHPKENFRPLMQAGPEEFYQRVIKGNNGWVEKKIAQSVLAQVEMDRLGELSDKSVIKMTTSMLLLLDDGIYDQLLEQPYLAASRNFYSREATSLNDIGTTPQLLKKIELRIEEEKERCINYLYQGTLPKILHIINQTMVVSFAQQLIDKPESGLVNMLLHDAIEDIHLMYRLFRGTEDQEALKPMRNTIKDFFIEQGRALAPEIVPKPGKASPANEWVKGVLGLKRRWETLYKESLDNDRYFQASIVEGFSTFMNALPQSAEFISLYFDEHLRSLASGKTEDYHVEAAQNDVLGLFRFLTDKDMFEAFYRSHLAKRMLMSNRTGLEIPAEDAEQSMVHKLRLDCGCQFTAKIEGMFKDFGTGLDTAQAFRTHIETSSRTMALDINVTVLTSSVWPLRAPSKCILPVELDHAANIYQDFYLHRHSGRKLTWMHHLGNAELRAQFATRRYDLITNTYQAVIILLFNSLVEEDEVSLTYEQIQEKSQLKDQELKRHLHSLSAAKYAILIKSSTGKEITKADTFKLNLQFRSQTIKVKLPTPLTRLDPGQLSGSQKPTSDTSNEATRAEVESARGHQIEAAIVRVMKTRRLLKHAQLVAEVTSHLQSRFQPDPMSIKKKIEALIDRDFLERTDNDMDTYHYLA